MDMEYFKPTSVRLGEAMERALQQWRKRHYEAEAASPNAQKTPVPPPFTVALSYEAGADGPGVARALGERLGWGVYDHELVERIAGELGVQTQLLESLDERQTNWLQELFQALFGGQAVSETAYVHHLAQTLFGLAAHGECVVVGHGGAQVLPPATTLRVRLVGPRQDRIAAARHRFGWSHEEAERWVERVDRERNAFIKEHFHKDPAAPDQYDLCLNVFRLSAAQCVEHIVAALRQLQAAAPLPPAASGGTR